MTRNAFDEFFANDLKSPAGERHYNHVRAQIDAIDGLFREMDARRERLGWSKAELARRADLNPVLVRRLFTQRLPNPTLQTVTALAGALGVTVTIAASDAISDVVAAEGHEQKVAAAAALPTGRS